MFKARMQQ